MLCSASWVSHARFVGRDPAAMLMKDDFRKPESRDIPSDTPAHKILERWVMEYFVSFMANIADARTRMRTRTMGRNPMTDQKDRLCDSQAVFLSSCSIKAILVPL